MTLDEALADIRRIESETRPALGSWLHRDQWERFITAHRVYCEIRNEQRAQVCEVVEHALDRRRDERRRALTDIAKSATQFRRTA